MRAFTIAEDGPELVVRAPSIEEPDVLDEIARFDDRDAARRYIVEVQERNRVLLEAGLA